MASRVRDLHWTALSVPSMMAVAWMRTLMYTSQVPCGSTGILTMTSAPYMNRMEASKEFHGWDKILAWSVKCVRVLIIVKEYFIGHVADALQYYISFKWARGSSKSQPKHYSNQFVVGQLCVGLHGGNNVEVAPPVG
jgi:hypothetical protein